MARQLAIVFDPMDPLDRGEYLRVQLRRKGVSLDDVVAHLGVSKGLVSSVLNGRKQSQNLVLGICAMLGIDTAPFISEAAQ